MTTRVAPKLGGLLMIASLALLAHCQAAPSPPPSSASTPPPPEIAYTRKEEWGAIVLFVGQSGSCIALATPPRIHAVTGETITWAVYNACWDKNKKKKEATVTIAHLRLIGKASPTTEPCLYFPESPKKDVGAGQCVESKARDENDPFEQSDNKSITVAVGTVAKLPLRIKSDAKLGLYKFDVYVDGMPDKDQEIDIWH
jgi:hypothetical protein